MDITTTNVLAVFGAFIGAFFLFFYLISILWEDAVNEQGLEHWSSSSLPTAYGATMQSVRDVEVLVEPVEPEILTPDHTGLWLMSGGLRATREAIRHNLTTFNFQSAFRRANVANALKMIAKIEDYYRAVDNLQFLNGDSLELRRVREQIDATVGEAQDHLRNVVNFCALFDINESFYVRAASEELDRVQECFDSLDKVFYEFAKCPPKQQQGLSIDLTNPDELDRLRKILGQLITGARDEQMVSISEIYPDALTTQEAEPLVASKAQSPSSTS